MRSAEAEQQLKTAVVPQLDTLKGDIEKHYKGLKGPTLKGQKDVDKARAGTQKHIESLGQSVAVGAKSDAKTDPYVVKRQALNSVNDQVLLENSQSEAVLSVQNNFLTLERHILQVLQQAVEVTEQILGGFAMSQAGAFKTVRDTFGAIERDHEWNHFTTLYKDQLVSSENYTRDPGNITFSNMDHELTIPVIEGIIQRKGTVMKQYSSGYYVLTPSGFLHEYKSADYIDHATPEMSIYMPESALGPMSDPATGKFTFSIHGKDAGKTIGAKHKYVFRTSTYEELKSWHEALAKACGTAVTSVDTDVVSSPEASPVVMSPTGAAAPAEPGAQAANPALAAAAAASGGTVQDTAAAVEKLNI
jgi:hypothetical protein